VNDPRVILIAGATLLMILATAGTAALRAWRGWLDLKRTELAQRRPDSRRSVVARIDIADLRERVRRLEAIADGSEGQRYG
jgi:hypothetical protein